MISFKSTFNIVAWVEPKLRKEWMQFQLEADHLGERLYAYMINYIDIHRHREKSMHADGTIPLSQSITLDKFTGMGQVGFGIGNIAKLQKESPYWYVLNYGAKVSGEKFIPANGGFIPGSFRGMKPTSGLSNGTARFNYNDGSGFGMKPKKFYRPINYIDATQRKFAHRLSMMINKMRRS